MADATITTEDISAWLDGELDAPRAEAVQAWLQSHPEDAALARHWATDRDALRERFAGVLDEPVPAALRAAAWRHTPPARWAQAAAAAGLLVVGALAGGAGVWQWQQQLVEAPAQAPAAIAGSPAQGWVQRAALAHAVYVPEPRHAVEVRAQEAHLAGWLTRRIEVPVKLFDLHAQGFELVGGRLLPDGAGKSAQLMYQDAQGRRVMLYLRKPEQPVATEFRYEQQGELGLFYWIEDGCGYALVGALPRPTLLALSESIYRQHALPAAAPASPAVPAPPPSPPSAPATPAPRG